MKSDTRAIEPRTRVLEAFRHREPAVLPYQWDMTPVDTTIATVEGVVDHRLAEPCKTQRG